MMKIALIGTHGTLKTTVAHSLCVALKQERYKIKLVQEVASDCPYEINGVDIEAQKWILVNQYSREMEAEMAVNGNRTPPDIVVCDRSTLDAYIYTVDLCKKQGMEIPKWMSYLTKASLSGYDFLFKTSIFSGGLIEDGTRSVDPVWQKEIFDLLNSYLQRWKVPHYCLPYSTIDGIENPSKNDLRQLAEEQVNYMIKVILNNGKGKSKKRR